MDDLGSAIFVVQHQLHRRALRHKNHEKRDIAARICQKQRRGRRAAGRTADCKAGGDGFSCTDAGLFLYDFIDCRADIDRQIHDRTGRAEENGRDEDSRQIEMLIPGIEQTLARLHDRAVDLKKVCKHRAQHSRHQNPECRAGYGGKKPTVPAVNQHQNHCRQRHNKPQRDPEGVISVQQARYQHLPHEKDGVDEG